MDVKSIRYKNELENLSKKERFGLFSQPPGLSIGDQFTEQKPPTGPKSVLINPSLKSTVTPALFQKPGFITLNDPYKEQFKIKQIGDKQREVSIPNSAPFKQTDVKKTIKNSEFEHMKEFNDKVYDTRGPNGEILVSPKGFYTNPHKKGFGNSTVGHLFEPVKYESEPHNRLKEFDIKERAEHKSKALEDAKPFLNMQSRNILFTPHMRTYGEDRPQSESKRKTFQYPGHKHPRPWTNNNPAKQGFNKTIGKFPEYIEEGEKIKNYQNKKLLSQTTYGQWKPNSYGTFQKPSPAISSLVTNYKHFNRFK